MLHRATYLATLQNAKDKSTFSATTCAIFRCETGCRAEELQAQFWPKLSSKRSNVAFQVAEERLPCEQRLKAENKLSQHHKARIMVAFRSFFQIVPVTSIRKSSLWT